MLERDAENSCLAGDGLEAGPMDQLLGSSITYRIAIGPQQGRKVFALQTLPACDEPFDDGVGKVAGFSLHAGVAARARIITTAAAEPTPTRSTSITGTGTLPSILPIRPPASARAMLLD